MQNTTHMYKLNAQGLSVGVLKKNRGWLSVVWIDFIIRDEKHFKYSGD